MNTEELFDTYLEGTIYKEKQVDSRGVHLTVSEIHAITGRGETDFGGSEHKNAETQPIEPEKRDPDDDYAWWELDQGTYRVIFNESARAIPGALLLVPNERILSCGCSMAPALVSAGSAESILTVPETGVSIKENARIALLFPLCE